MKNADQPAYPIDGVEGYSAIVQGKTGLTKREAFAMAAMQGILANRELQLAVFADLSQDNHGKRVLYPENINHDNVIAYESIKFADSLLKFLES